jgi:hypothetical protein
MKKLLLTITTVLVLGFSVNAQRDAFFTWNDASDDVYRTNESGVTFDLPQSHGQDIDFDSNAPIGSGLLVFTALGLGYAFRKKSRV